MSKEALKLALKVLEEIHVGNMTPMAEINWNKAIIAIKEALAQPEQEPVAWVRWDEEGYWDVRRGPPSDEAVHYLQHINRPPWVPAYPHPPQREWQGLTDEEIDVLVMDSDGLPKSHLEFARAIEAVHGIKENT